MERIETLILDLGNVLMFHDNQLLFSRLSQIAGLRGQGVEQRIPTKLWDDIHRGALDEEGIRREVCAALGIDLTRADFWEVWNCHFRKNDKVLPYVQRLVGRVKLLLLSNTNVIHTRYFTQELPILGQFDGLLLSHELKLVKPEREIYLEALRRSDSRPEATAYFDDIPEYVDAARSLGIQGHVFRSVPEFIAQLSELGLNPVSS
jgi:putative hydrolase of the HAD superfamily